MKCSRAFSLFLYATFSLFLLFQTAYSQTQSRDVVYLKNGSVIKGEIIEQVPNKSIKIQTADGNIFVYDFSEIEKITKEPNLSSSTAQSRDLISELNNFKRMFSISGGVSIPVGDFASTEYSNQDAGFGQTGFSISMEYNYPFESLLYWPIALTLTYNSINEDKIKSNSGALSVSAGPIIAATPTTGIGFQFPISPELCFKASFQVGLTIGNSPQVDFKRSSYSYKEESTIFTAFTYGLTGSIQTSSNFIFSIRYLSAKPEVTTSYVITTPGWVWVGTNSSTRDVEKEHPLSIIQLMVGVAL